MFGSLDFGNEHTVILRDHCTSLPVTHTTCIAQLGNRLYDFRCEPVARCFCFCYVLGPMRNWSLNHGHSIAPRMLASNTCSVVMELPLVSVSVLATSLAHCLTPLSSRFTVKRTKFRSPIWFSSPPWKDCLKLGVTMNKLEYVYTDWWARGAMACTTLDIVPCTYHRIMSDGVSVICRQICSNLQQIKLLAVNEKDKKKHQQLFSEDGLLPLATSRPPRVWRQIALCGKRRFQHIWWQITETSSDYVV